MRNSPSLELFSFCCPLHDVVSYQFINSTFQVSSRLVKSDSEDAKHWGLGIGNTRAKGLPNRFWGSLVRARSLNRVRGKPALGPALSNSPDGTPVILLAPAGECENTHVFWEKPPKVRRLQFLEIKGNRDIEAYLIVINKANLSCYRLIETFWKCRKGQFVVDLVGVGDNRCSSTYIVMRRLL